MSSLFFTASRFYLGGVGSHATGKKLLFYCGMHLALL